MSDIPFYDIFYDVITKEKDKDFSYQGKNFRICKDSYETLKKTDEVLGIEPQKFWFLEFPEINIKVNLECPDTIPASIIKRLEKILKEISNGVKDVEVSKDDLREIHVAFIKGQLDKLKQQLIPLLTKQTNLKNKFNQITNTCTFSVTVGDVFLNKETNDLVSVLNVLGGLITYKTIDPKTSDFRYECDVPIAKIAKIFKRIPLKINLLEQNQKRQNYFINLLEITKDGNVMISSNEPELLPLEATKEEREAVDKDGQIFTREIPFSLYIHIADAIEQAKRDAKRVAKEAKRTREFDAANHLLNEAKERYDK